MKFYMILATVIFLLDQITKQLVQRSIPFGEATPLIDGVFYFTHITNSGAAFGMFRNFTWLLIILSVIIIVGVIYIIEKRKITCIWQKLGLAFTLGGALGNLFDRIVFGAVIDFLDFRLINFPVFNIADIFIVIGAILLILTIIFAKKTDEK